jgi:hypothetical protein
MCARPLLARLLAASALLAVSSSAANATVFYSNNFENGSSYSEWSSNQQFTTATNFSRFLGRYMNSGVTLNVPQPVRPGNDQPGPGGATQLLLQFHLYIIDSWDGSEATNGPDHFGIRVNNTVIFDETFANQHAYQTYDAEPDVGRTQLGFDQRWDDSIYHMSIPFDTAAPTISVQFFAYGLLGAIADESWGVDNVRLSVVPVPAPGAAGLGLAAGSMLLRRRRRA